MRDHLYQARRMAGPFSFADPEDMVRADVAAARMRQARQVLDELERQRRLRIARRDMAPGAVGAPMPSHPTPAGPIGPVGPVQRPAPVPPSWRSGGSDDRTLLLSRELMRRYAKHLANPDIAGQFGIRPAQDTGEPAGFYRASLSYSLPSRSGEPVGPKRQDVRPPAGIRLAQAVPTIGEGFALGAPIFAGPLLHMLRTNENFRAQFRRAGIDPGVAIKWLSAVAGGPLTPIEQQLKRFLSNPHSLTYDPTDLVLRSAERAYLYGRISAQPRPGDYTPAVSKSDAARRIATAIYGDSQRHQMPPLGSSLPHIPPEWPEDDRIEQFPAEDERSPFILGYPAYADELPDIEGFQPDDLPNLVEIFPDQGTKFPNVTILESRGNDWTQAGLNWLRGFGERLADVVNPNAEHVGGAHRSNGTYLKETYLKNRQTGRLGSSKVDLTFRDLVTGRRLFINTVDTKAKGTQETKREHGAGVRIIVNAEKGDVLLLIHKIEEGEAWNEEELERLFSELLREIGRPEPEVDPRTSRPLEDLIHRILRNPPFP